MVAQPMVLEEDIGPYRAWKWAHAEQPSDRYFRVDNWFLRVRGYVLWDHARLLK